MIDIYSPRISDIHRLQDAEKAFYWSLCAEALLRKHGVLSCAPRHIGLAPRDCAIMLRNVRPEWPLAEACAIIEGPLSDEMLAGLGLEAQAGTCTAASWLDENRRHIAYLLYSTFSVKRIPSRRGEVTEPYPYEDPDPRWNNRTIRYQAMRPAGDWRPIAYLKPDSGEPVPAAVTDGRKLVLGVPLFDLIGFVHALPVLDAGFYASIENTYLYELERWLVGRVQDIATAAGAAVATAPIWPNGHTGALSIRHDFDRPISDTHLAEMLAFYGDRGLKATWFLIIDKMPPDKQLDAILDAGHELALHTVAPHFDDFREEVRRFQELTGLFPDGYTCHGGIGSRGQLGLAQYQWSETLGLRYGEMIGRGRALPHAVHRPVCGIPEPGRLIVQNSHYSLDVNTRPEGHALERLLETIPSTLTSGAHVIVMNHPDIHWAELRRLLEQLDLSGIWLCTFEEAAAWTETSKFEMARYPGALPDPDRIRAWRPEGLGRRALLAMPDSQAEPPADGYSGAKRAEVPAAVNEALERLGVRIRDWFQESGRASSPSAIAGTVQMNTTDIPARVERLLRPIAESLEKRGNLAFLDIGCGYGGIPIYLAGRFPNAHVTALDTTDRFFRVGKASAGDLALANLEFRVEDILNLTERECYDVVVLSNVINYLTTREALERACANVMRALKPGGWAIIHTPHAWSYREPFTRLPMLHLLPRQARGKVSARFGKRATFSDIRLPSAGELRRIFARHDGTIIRRHPVGLRSTVASTHLSLWIRKGQADG